MRTNATRLLAETTSAVAAPLQIVVTCDHPAMARAARKLLDGYLADWAADVDVHRDEWGFAELEHPQCRREALELARDCDVFTIAIGGTNDLPESFTGWLKDWLETRARKEAALILCVGGAGGFISNLPVCASLPIMARSRGLSFFATQVAVQGTELPPAIHPKTLLSKLGALNSDCLPDFSGLNE